jgi:hypothetical protein
MLRCATRRSSSTAETVLGTRTSIWTTAIVTVGPSMTAAGSNTVPGPPSPRGGEDDPVRPLPSRDTRMAIVAFTNTTTNVTPQTAVTPASGNSVCSAPG